MKQSLNITPTITIEQRVERRLDLKSQIDALEAERKEEDAEIQAALHAAGVESMIVGDYKVSVVAVDGRTSIDRMKLLEAGVTTAQIKAAESQGEGYVRLDVRDKPKGKGKSR